MKESIESVKGTQNVFFVGAGISANPPTGFPTAGAILVQLLRAITTKKGFRDRLCDKGTG
jgi:hypothetical protein